MTATKLVLSAVTALLLGATPNTAALDDHRDPFESMWNSKKLLRGAMFTDAQVAQIRDLRKPQLDHAKALEAQKKALWDQFDEKLTSTGTINPTELTALAKQAQQLADQEEDEKVTILVQMRALLTADQLRRVSDTHQKTKALNDQLQAFEPTIASERGQ
jgi:Spy/CpxP family protein refolding chaperone